MILHATEAGAGEPVVLLHGLFGRLQNLGTLARRLAQKFRVISLDLRNHGASPHAPGMSYETMSEDVLETLAQRGVTRAAVLGHSMGGKVAMIAALTRPETIDRLVVADIAPIAYRHSNAAVAAALLSLPLAPGLQRHEADRHLAEAAPDPSVRAFLLQNLALGEAPAWRIGLPEIAAGMRLIEGFPSLQTGTRFDGPTLFIRGETSGYVKDSARPAIEALFPAARIETLAGAGHWLHADQPQAFTAIVEAFLRAGLP
jgi:pimeloyl-ACP methyl ester carboxylesterase